MCDVLLPPGVTPTAAKYMYIISPVHINQAIIPQTEAVKYLDLHFDKRLTWREYATKTMKHLYSGTSVHELNPFLEFVRKPKLFFP
jgi:hypothetical protein